MYNIDKFEFTASPNFVANVTVGAFLNNKDQLLEWIAKALSFPEYFGKNWDALIDCLGDLSWFDAVEVIIDHSGLPTLRDNDLRLYLESLVDALERKSSLSRPRLRVVFRHGDMQKIVDIFES